MSGAVVAFAWVALWLYLLACGLWVACEVLPDIARRAIERRRYDRYDAS